ncbi:hypothetical protein R1sor_011253 [Riccia sorocarpa]|uniref:Ribosomal RNA-processing protein 8 n=1 Tax=Riccia sorocarpa TaxID=122646 RepID=A0ABD3I343_9MARC
MESERSSNDSGNSKKRKKSSTAGGGASGEQIPSERSALSTVKSGRVRKPKRGSRGGVGRRRNHKNFGLENGEPGVEKKGTNCAVESAGGTGDKAEKNVDEGKSKKKRKSLDAASQEQRHQESAETEKEKLKPGRKKSKSKVKKSTQQVDSAVAESDERTEPAKRGSKSQSFLEKMRAKLSGGRFRMLNESLYTCKGDEAFELFQEDPGAFELYHTGYQEQMSKWPVLPITVVTKWLKSHSPSLVVADFGCGDARLAKSVRNKVFSMDLVSSDPSVIACNIAKTPLETASVDVAVFCLSLMGTDYPTFLHEAHRVLRSRGWLLIAEVKSRLDSGNGGAGARSFISAIISLGFVLDSEDASNKMFHMFYFQKEDSKKEPKGRIKWPELKPCIYKRR